MKRILAIMATLVAALSFLLPAQPASAAEGKYFSKFACVDYSPYDVRTCFQVNWDKQSDGDGIFLQRMKLTTPVNCKGLNDNPPYEATGVHSSPEGGGDPQLDYPMGNGCTQYWSSGKNLADKGAAVITYKGRANVPGAIYPDVKLILRILIRTNGSSEIIDAIH